jgi:hypothetical protein
MKQLPLAALPLLLAVAGCGGSSAAVGGGAAAVPANVRAFVAVAPGAPLDQLRAVMPREAALVARVRATHEGEIDAAELASGHVVALTREHGKWAPAFSGPHLADAAGYRNASAMVADDARIRGYLAPGEAARLVRSLPGQLQVVPNPSRHPFPLRRPLQELAARRFVWGAAELTGDRFSAFVRSLPPTQAVLGAGRYVEVFVPPFVPHLPDEIPADATSVVDFEAPSSMVENTDRSVLPARLRKLIDASPQLPSELDQLIGGETAVYRRAGGEVTILTQPADTRGVASTLASVERELQITVPLHFGFLGGELIISTSPRAIGVFRGNGPKLAADPAFRKAASAAGLPAQTTGFVYQARPATIGWGEHDGGLIRFFSVVR